MVEALTSTTPDDIFNKSAVTISKHFVPNQQPTLRTSSYHRRRHTSSHLVRGLCNSSVAGPRQVHAFDRQLQTSVLRPSQQHSSTPPPSPGPCLFLNSVGPYAAQAPAPRRFKSERELVAVQLPSRLKTRPAGAFRTGHAVGEESGQAACRSHRPDRQRKQS